MYSIFIKINSPENRLQKKLQLESGQIEETVYPLKDICDRCLRGNPINIV